MNTILGHIRRADEEFRMIQPGDKIGIGLSGGKDSLLMLKALSLYRYVRHGDFTLQAFMLTMGHERPDTSAIEAFCKECDVPLTIRHTDFYEILFDVRKEKNPCALCAKMRRGALCDACVDNGCNKLALGHNRDDALETFLMSLVFEGRLHVFHPCTFMERSQITLIRPIIFVPEKEVIGMKRKLNLPVMTNPCPANGYTKREEMKQLLKELCKRYPDLDEKMLSALRNTDQYALWEHE